MAGIHCWFFETRAIQAFIFDSGRLSEAVGGSLLIDRLTGDLVHPEGSLLDAVVLASGSSRPYFSRRGGGAFQAFFDSESQLCRTRQLWQWALQFNAPGLQWADGVGSAEGAHEAIELAVSACRAAGPSSLAHWPEAGPLAMRSPRTGEPAQATKAHPSGLLALDAASVARLAHVQRRAHKGTLLSRFGHQPGWIWPVEMDPSEVGAHSRPEAAVVGTGKGDSPEPGPPDAEDFPFSDASGRNIAFLKADGNGLGLLLRQLMPSGAEKQAVAVDRQAAIERLAAFSRAVSDATASAASQATAEVLFPAARSNPDGTLTMPARPLLLGGDDVLLMVRADLALAFAQSFLLAFERASAQALARLRWPGQTVRADTLKLTASCGVAIVKAGFPFARAHALAEELCDRAKRALRRDALAHGSQRLPSAIAFQRVTGSLASTERPMVTLSNPRRRFPLGYDAYVLATREFSTTLPRFADLQLLAERLSSEAEPRGPVRRLLTDLETDTNMAEERYRRWRELTLKRSAEGAKVLAAWDESLSRWGVREHERLPLGPEGCPWPDLIVLRDFWPAAAATGVTS